MNDSFDVGADSRIDLTEDYYRDLWSRLGEASDLPRWELDRWREIERLIAHIEAMTLATDATPPLRVLDLGCGRGWITSLIADRLPASDVSGIHPLESSVEAARAIAPHLQFQRGTADDLLADGQAGGYDLIVSSEVIEHVPNDQHSRFLSSAYELLRPGGHLVLTTPRGEFWPNWLQQGLPLQPVENWLTERELDRLTQHAQFTKVLRSRTHLPTRPMNWQGWIDKWILGRRWIRQLPTRWLRRQLQYSAAFFQIVLLRRR